MDIDRHRQTQRGTMVNMFAGVGLFLAVWGIFALVCWLIDTVPARKVK